jgi:hypothetical protein
MELPLGHKQKNTCFHNVEIRKYGVNKSMEGGETMRFNPPGLMIQNFDKQDGLCF